MLIVPELLFSELFSLLSFLPIAVGFFGLFGRKENKLEKSRRKFGSRVLQPYWKDRGYYDPDKMQEREDEIGTAIDPRDYGEFGREFDFTWDGDRDKLTRDLGTNFYNSDLVGEGGALRGAFDTVNKSLIDVVGDQITDYTAGTSPWAIGDKTFLDKQREYAGEDRDSFLSGEASKLAGSGLLSSSAMERAAGDAARGYDRTNLDAAFGLYQGNKDLWGQLGAQDKGSAMNLLNLGQQDYYQGIANRLADYGSERDFAGARFDADRDFWGQGRDRWLAAQEEAKRRQKEMLENNKDRAGTIFG